MNVKFRRFGYAHYRRLLGQQVITLLRNVLFYLGNMFVFVGRYVERLRVRMITAAARREELAAQEETPDAPSTLPLPGERALLIQACTTCRGSCCQLGDTKAYLGVETLLRFLNRHPHQSAEEAVAEYESHLPKHSYDGSCVYHSERGCGLPTDHERRILNALIRRSGRER